MHANTFAALLEIALNFTLVTSLNKIKIKSIFTIETQINSQNTAKNLPLMLRAIAKILENASKDKHACI